MYELQYGVPTDKCALTVRMGIDRGFFRDEGIDLSVKVVFGGPPLAEAYNNNELQIGEIGSPPGVIFMSRGYKFKVVGGALRRKAHMYFGARPGINNWEDMKGKRLGLLSRGSCPEWYVRAMLVHRGLDPDNHLEYVGLLDNYERIMDLLADGSLDGAICVEPAMAIGESRGVLRCWGAVYDETYLPQFQWIIHVARPDFIAKEPELVTAVLRACKRSAHYAAANVEEWIDYGATHYQTDRSTAERAVRRELPHLHLDGQVDLKGLQEMIELQRRLGVVERPMTVDEICDLRFMPQVTGDEGSEISQIT